MHAILTTYDKRGIVDFARGLVQLGWTLTATSGTGRAICEAGLPVRSLEDLTGSPALFGGRVKGLHPTVFGGLLYRRGVADDEAAAAARGIPAIDLVACNLTPMLGTAAGDGTALPCDLERIDVGGAAMIRAAAKNSGAVLPLVDPADYAPILDMLRQAGGSPADVTPEVRRHLAVKAFRYTSEYDASIVATLSASDDQSE